VRYASKACLSVCLTFFSVLICGAGLIAASGNALAVKQEDPALFCAAYRKNRFYWFSKREPKDEGYDSLCFFFFSNSIDQCAHSLT
jgi:hypothetical protein